MGFLLKLSDKFGRQKMLVYGCIFQVIVIASLLLSKDYRAYYVLLFFSGLSFSKDILLYIYIIELVPQKYQVYMGAYSFTLHSCLVVLIVDFYFFMGGKHWEYAYLPALITMSVSTILSLFIPESPRYLYSKNDWFKLKKNLNYIATVNGRTTFRDTRDSKKLLLTNEESKFDNRFLINENNTTNIDSCKNEENYSILRTLMDRVVLSNFAILLALFSAGSFNFHMLGFYLKYAGGDIYVNTLCSALSDLVGCF